MISLNGFSLSQFSGLQLLDLLLALPLMLGGAICIGLFVFGQRIMQGPFHQFMRNAAIKEARSGKPILAPFKLVALYIGLFLVLDYIGSVYFAWSLLVIGLITAVYGFYYAWIVGQLKAGKLD